MLVIKNIEALPEWLGHELATSDWITIEQSRIQAFADATDDRQWIHVDPERARRESPFATTIAHGYLTLSMLPAMIDFSFRIDGIAMTVNYGLDRVRFMAPLPAGSRIRARFALDRLTEFPGGTQAHIIATIEMEGSDKPVCIAHQLVRYYR
ncbi:MaoC family dehydratase [Solilutibacter silvestris]|uniref:Acyl dehydratase n=1 Tax=Solilutibacter silvestris TaxID=1645665 RepID=A0A2K1Q0M7_9GAMM|nr:MaoC family dehydratase [Lysobacter silvestris]PNS08467.1 Acyl dehydratase [Lysobacter silvestris]